MKKRVVVWRITQDCNMNCRFCSYSNEVERKRNDADVDEVRRLAEILGRHKKETGEELLISWIGGEPFLWKPMLPLSANLSEQFGIAISATTNGILLSAEYIREQIIRYFSEIVISLDGFESCDDEVRKYSGHFKQVTENIRKLKQERDAADSNLKIKVNTILMRRNIEQFQPFCKYLSELGVDELTFNQLGGYDRPEFYEDNRLRFQQVIDFLEQIPEWKKEFERNGLVIHGSYDYLQRIRMTAENQKNPIGECNPGTWFWFINENGYISPCSYTSYEYMYNTGKIQTPEDVMKVEAYFRKLRKEKRSDWCSDCYCTQVYDKFA